ILIVEGDLKIARVLKIFLSHARYSLEFVSDGARALEVFEQWNPALVLLDVMLPGNDGWSILRSIRERSACPVIMLTAVNETKDRISGLKSGADDYIGKPFTGEEVVARVDAV